MLPERTIDLSKHLDQSGYAITINDCFLCTIGIR